MKARFLHCADIHLGHQQYGLPERFSDFDLAFQHVMVAAIQNKVDFVLLAGDLFHKRAVEPQALAHAITGLELLRTANIPVIAVEGNHERPHYREKQGWLDFLDGQGYLQLLNPHFDEGVPALEPHRRGSGGAYVDVGGVRIYGVKYFGAATGRVLDGLATALAAMDRADYTVLLMHGGLEGVLPHVAGGLRYEQFTPLNKLVDYVALGHFHKPYERDGWLHNPGSLETVSIDEVQWPERGYFLVEIDTNKKSKHTARLIPCPRRAFVRLSQDVTQCGSPAKLIEVIRKLAAKKASDGGDAPIVEIELRGTLAFDSSGLDFGEVEAAVQEGYEALRVLVKNATTRTDFEVLPPEEGQSRAELERQVLADLLGRDARYRPASAEWAEAALQVKQMSLSGTSPAGIMAYLRDRRGKLSKGER